MDISQKAGFFLHNVQTKMRGKTFPTTAHKKCIFELVKWICFVDTEIHKIKIPRFTGKQFQYIIRFIERPVYLSK